MKLRIHPLFFAFGLYFAFSGKVFLFLTFTLTALLHEYGHALKAEKLGYKINNISLMPYGAVVNGAIEGLSYKDEITVALAGPFANLFISAMFVCLWWLIPESYPYTDTVVFSNVSVAAINLLPAYPLDGGRIISAMLSQLLNRKTAMLLIRMSGIIIGAALAGLFVYSCFTTVNFSILFFALFIITGSISKTKENAYVKIFKGRTYFSGGVKESKRLVVCSSLTLKQLLNKTEGNCFYSLDIADKKSGKIIPLSVEQTEQLLESYMLYDSVENIVKKLHLLRKKS